MSSPVKSVTISLADAAPKLSDFGIIGMLCKCPYAGEPQTYSADAEGLAAMVDDGFTTSDEAYIMLQALNAQENGQGSAKFYPRTTLNAQEYTFTPTKTTVGTRYTLGLQGYGGGEVLVDYTVQSGDDASDIVTALIAQIVAQTPAIIGVGGFADGTYTARIDGTNYSYVAASKTADQIGTELAAVIDAAAGLVATYDSTDDEISVTHLDGSKVTITSVTSPSSALTIEQQGAGPSVGLNISAALDSGTLVLTPTVSGTRFWVNEFCAWLTLADTSTASSDLDDDLAAMLENDPDFYGLLIDSTCPGEHSTAATFAASAGKMFVGLTVESENGTSSDLDVASTIAGAEAFYAKLFYHKRTKQRPDVAWMGKVFGHGPAFGWHALRLQNVTAPKVKAAFKGFLDSKLVGYYTTELGLSFTQNTKFPGRYPDLVRGFDWFKQRVHAACLKVFVDNADNGGVGFDDPGIGKFVGALYSEARVGVGNDLLAADPAPEVVAVAAADVSDLDKSNRDLPAGSLKINATLKGKIESMAVQVVVTP